MERSGGLLTSPRPIGELADATGETRRRRYHSSSQDRRICPNPDSCSVAPHDLAVISYLTDAYPLLSEHRAWIAWC